MTREFGTALVVEDLTLGAPQRQEVRVRIGAVAVCGSDLHAGDGAWGGRLPAVLGHETAGVVDAVGPEVTSVVPGDRVVVSILRYCGSCFYCAGGQAHLCSAEVALDSETRLHDAAGDPVVQGMRVGGFAEEVVVHESQVVPVPDGIPLDRACLLACGVVTGYGAVVNTAGVPAGASVVVVGTGGVGINCVQGARAAGGHPIVAVDVSEPKLDFATRLGATHGRRADHPALGREIRSLTEGRGADFVFVAVGRPAAVEEGLALVRPGGTLVVVGMSRAGEHARVEMSEFAAGSRRILGSRMGSMVARRDIPMLAARYQAGELRLDELISGRYPLEAINEAVASARAADSLRSLVVFEGVAS